MEAAELRMNAAPQRLLTPRRVLWTVALVSLAAHLWVMASTCLVIENDGIDYLSTAVTHLRDAYQISRFRTPGYPLFLYACFKLFGVGAFGIMLVQHLCAAITPVLVTRISLKVAPAPLALASGLFCALDPTLALFGSVMQTECVTIFLFVLACTLAMFCDRRPILTALALGAVLGFAVLVRPTFQVVVPFLFLGAAFHAGMSRLRRASVLAFACAAFAAAVAPWLAFNRDRGIPGFAEGSGAAFWVSLVQQDLVDREYPLPPDVERRYEKMKPFKGATNEMWWFVAHPADSYAQQSRMFMLTKRWAIHSVKKDPLAYLARTPYSFLWQMNYFPKSGFIQNSQISWFSYMVSCDVDDFKATIANFHFDGAYESVQPLAMSGRGGPAREMFAWWAPNHPRGVPQIPLMLGALGTGLLCLWRRDWPLGFVLLSSAALVGAHVVLLFHQGRYSLPSIALWYAVAPVVPVAAWRALLRPLRGDSLAHA